MVYTLKAEATIHQPAGEPTAAASPTSTYIRLRTFYQRHHVARDLAPKRPPGSAS